MKDPWTAGKEASMSCVAKCAVCGCTDHDCRGCVERTGQPCWWFGPNLCSACAIGSKGLSLWQPWAGFVAMHEKTIETRLWTTSYRGPMLICSAKRFDEQWRHVSSRPNSKWFGTAGCTLMGHALCVATLADCRPMEKRDEDASMVRFNPAAGRYSWVLEDIRPVKPFAVIGRQRLFNVDESILRKAV